MRNKINILFFLATCFLIWISSQLNIGTTTEGDFPYDLILGFLISLLGVFTALFIERRYVDHIEDKKRVAMLGGVWFALQRNHSILQDVIEDIKKEPENPTPNNLDLVFLESTSAIRYDMFSHDDDKDMNWNINKASYQLRMIEQKILNTQRIRKKSKVSTINEEIITYIQGKQHLDAIDLTLPLLEGLKYVVDLILQRRYYYEKRVLWPRKPYTPPGFKPRTT